MKIDILSTNGEALGRAVELPEEVFGIEPNEHAMYLAVKHYLKNQRQGTHKAKERGEVVGSTRKIKRQKGTGTARAGDIKSPVFRGGGTVFGPRPRTYSSKVNQKVKQLAKNSALSAKAKEGQIMVVEDFSFDKPTTKGFVDILNNLNLKESKVLFVTADNDRVLYLSSRNYPKAAIAEVRNLNVYDILNAGILVFAESAITGYSNTDHNQ